MSRPVVTDRTLDEPEASRRRAVFWTVTGLVEVAVILTGVALLVYYAVR